MDTGVHPGTHGARVYSKLSYPVHFRHIFIIIHKWAVVMRSVASVCLCVSVRPVLVLTFESPGLETLSLYAGLIFRLSTM